MPREVVCASRRRKVRRRRGAVPGIDVLPDEALRRVLSFLPVREAVRTCVLARRWRHLWRAMPVLRITFEDSELTPAEDTDLNAFVDPFMSHRDLNAPLDLWELHLPEFDLEEEEPHVSVWIQRALLSQARVLKLTMPSLGVALVRFRDSSGCCGREEFGGSCTDKFCKQCVVTDGIGDCILLKGLSQAKCLELVAEPGAFIFKRDLMWCPTFSNLKTLLLNEWCVAIDFYALICFLEHAPVLEKLTLQLCKAPDNWVKPRGSYIPLEVPLASRELKVVEVKCEEFDDRVHQISRMLSIYNPYIEQINIQWSARRSC
ncbi:hypothetical protein ACP4OV_015019 [Aristida adscensionis]